MYKTFQGNRDTGMPEKVDSRIKSCGLPDDYSQFLFFRIPWMPVFLACAFSLKTEDLKLNISKCLFYQKNQESKQDL